MESYLERTGQAMHEASVVARQAAAINRGGLAAAESIRDRAVKERNTSRAEASEANAPLSSAATQIREHQSNINLQLDLRRESDAVLAVTRAELCDQQEAGRQQEAMLAASDARAQQLAQDLGTLRAQGSALEKQNVVLLEACGLAGSEWYPSRVGGTEERVGGGGVQSLQHDIELERVKVLRLARKERFMGSMVDV